MLEAQYLIYAVILLALALENHFRIKKAADVIVRRNFFVQEWLGSFFNEFGTADTIKISVDIKSRGVEVFKSDSVVGRADFERNFAFRAIIRGGKGSCDF